jgi:hypothetical protein
MNGSVRSLPRLSRVARRVAVLLLLVSRVADAHAIHTTVTQLTADGRGLTVMIRAFADDLSSSVAKHAGRPAPADHAVPDADAQRYVRAQLMIGTVDRRLVTLESCGVRRAEDMYWLCFRAPMPQGLAGASIRNQMLTELHADQINIVQVDDRGARQTLLFRKGSAPGTVRAGA